MATAFRATHDLASFLLGKGFRPGTKYDTKRTATAYWHQGLKRSVYFNHNGTIGLRFGSWNQFVGPELTEAALLYWLRVDMNSTHQSEFDRLNTPTT